MWLLKSEALAEIRSTRSLLAPIAAAQQAEFVAISRQRDSDENPSNYSVAGDVAQIDVSGVLVQQPSFLLWLMGMSQTTYSSIRRSLAVASSDPKVKRVVLAVDSPGGTVDGLFDTLAALESFAKPMSVVAACACSAAYAIAALAGPITAVNAAADFGSVGVAVAIEVDDNVVDITSTEAPNKRPDVTTPEGKAVVRERLDAIHDLFADAIARGRGTDVAAVNANYGRGGTLLAGAARQRGMIDSIAAKPISKRRSKASAENIEHGPQMQRALELCEQAAPTGKLLELAERMPNAATPAPARTERPAADLGDQVWALFEAQRTGKSVEEVLGIAPAPPPSTVPDLTDMVWENLEAERAGKPRPHVPAEPALVIPEGKDLGDLVWERFEASQLGKKKAG